MMAVRVNKIVSLTQSYKWSPLEAYEDRDESANKRKRDHYYLTRSLSDAIPEEKASDFRLKICVSHSINLKQKTHRNEQNEKIKIRREGIFNELEVAAMWNEASKLLNCRWIAKSGLQKNRIERLIRIHTDPAGIFKVFSLVSATSSARDSVSFSFRSLFRNCLHISNWAFPQPFQTKRKNEMKKD